MQFVVTITTIEPVITVTTEQQIIRTVAPDDVVQFVAAPYHCAAAGQGQVLDIGTQEEVSARLNRINTRIKLLDHHIPSRIDRIQVITRTTGHKIIARAAIQAVVAFATD